MFDYVRLFGPSENWGPHDLLQQLDGLLLSVGWERVGQDPTPLTYDIGTNRTGDYHTHKRQPIWGPFGYKQPVTEEHIWFMANPQWGIHNTDDYTLGLQLYLGFRTTWDPNTPEGVVLLASHFIDLTHLNNDAEWLIGAGPEGFYLLQTSGAEPGGFAVERTLDGTDRWLIHTIDNQSRWHERGGWTYVATGATGATPLDQWYDGDVDALAFQRLGNDIVYIGRCSVLYLALHDDHHSGQALTPDGPLQYGYWYQMTGFHPVISNLFRRWYDPNNYVEVVEDEDVKRFRKFGVLDMFRTLSWRVA